MPWKLRKPCARTGCPQLVNAGEAYCPDHRRDDHRRYQRERQDVDEQKFYRSLRWLRTRALKLRQNPLCEQCDAEGRITPAALVHHRQAIKAGGHPTAAANLVSLCTACHNRAHGAAGGHRG